MRGGYLSVSTSQFRLLTFLRCWTTSAAFQVYFGRKFCRAQVLCCAEISGPGMSEAQAILSLTLNSHHRNLITASDSGQDSCEPGDSDELNVGCPTLRYKINCMILPLQIQWNVYKTVCVRFCRNALAVALTVPPRDIQLRYVDTANGRVDFQVLGGRAARQAVEEAIDATHTDSGVLTRKSYLPLAGALVRSPTHHSGSAVSYVC